jgi:hypothetical protein
VPQNGLGVLEPVLLAGAAGTLAGEAPGDEINVPDAIFHAMSDRVSAMFTFGLSVLRLAVLLRLLRESPFVGAGSSLTSEGSDVVVDDGAGEPGGEQSPSELVGLADPGMLEPSHSESAVEESGPGETRSAGRRVMHRTPT